MNVRPAARRPRLRTALVAAVLLLTTVGVPAAEALVANNPDPTWGTNGDVYQVLHLGDTVYLGGSFTALQTADGSQSIPAENLAALDARTGQPVTGWRPTASNPNNAGQVYAMAAAPDGSVLYIGGAFSSVNGASRKFMAALDPVSGGLLPFKVNFGFTVQSILPTAAKIYVGGDFTTVAGQPRQHLAAVDVNGVLDPLWAPATKATYADNVTKTQWNGRVKYLLPSADGSQIYVAGDFTAINGTPRRSLGAVSATDGSTIGGFAPYVESSTTAGGQHVYKLIRSGNVLYAAMAGRLNYLQRYDATTGCGAPTDPAKPACSLPAATSRVQGDGDFQGMSLVGTTLYVGGHFDNLWEYGNSANLTPHSGLGAIDVSTMTVIRSFTPQVRYSGGTSGTFFRTWAVDASADQLFIGGAFQVINATRQPHVAIFSTPDVTAPSTPANLSAAADSSTSVTVGWDASTDDRAVTGYEVWRDGVPVATTAAPGFTDTSVAPSTSYGYQVRARDATGNWSPASGSVSVTTPASPPPTAPTVSGGTNTPDTSYLDWTASSAARGVVAYEVYRDGVLQATVAPSTLSYADAGLTAGTAYQYVVAARDGAGVTTASAPVTATTPAASTLFQDGFERGTTSAWSGVSSFGVQSSDVATGAFGARAAAASGSGNSYAWRLFGSPAGEVWYRFAVKPVTVNPTGKTVLARLQRTTAAPQTLANVYLTASGGLGYRNEIAGADHGAGATVTMGGWHTIVVHVTSNDPVSSVELYLDGVRVLSRADTFGPGTVMGRAELGDNAGGKTFDVAYDDVALGTAPLN